MPANVGRKRERREKLGRSEYEAPEELVNTRPFV